MKRGKYIRLEKEGLTIKTANYPTEEEIHAEDIKGIQGLSSMSQESREKQVKIISELLDYFENNKLEEGNVEQRKQIQEKIEEIFNLEMENMKEDFESNIELIFNKHGQKGVMGEYRDNKSVTLYTNQLFEALKSDDKEERIDGCGEVLSTLFHEVQHHRQYLMATNEVSSKEAMDFAKEFAVIDLLQENFYNENYDNLDTEKDAEEVAQRKTVELTGGNSEAKYEMLKNSLEKRTEEESLKVDSDNGYYKYQFDSQEKDEMMDDILTDLIVVKGHSEVLERYPILRKIYKNDRGFIVRRTPREMIKEMKKEQQEILDNKFLSEEEKKEAIKDSKEMYIDIIYKRIRKGTPALIKEIDKKDLEELLNDMEDNFKAQKLEKLLKANEVTELKYKNVNERAPKILKPVTKSITSNVQKIEENRNEREIEEEYKEKQDFLDLIKQGKLPEEKISTKTKIMRKIRPVVRFFGKVKDKIKRIGRGIKNVVKSMLGIQEEIYYVPSEEELKEGKVLTQKSNIRDELKVEIKNNQNEVLQNQEKSTEKEVEEER